MKIYSPAINTQQCAEELDDMSNIRRNLLMFAVRIVEHTTVLPWWLRVP